MKAAEVITTLMLEPFWMPLDQIRQLTIPIIRQIFNHLNRQQESSRLPEFNRMVQRLNAIAGGGN